MANLREIRRRIRSVRSTAQITRAMQMVAAARMRKAQQAALTSRPYSSLLQDVLAQASANAGRCRHPLMAERPAQSRAVIVLSTDKGLCGSLNTNLLREALRFDPAATTFITVGRKGAQFLARTKRRLLAEFSCHDTSLFADSRVVNWFACQLFLGRDVDHVDVLYPRFVSTLQQQPAMAHLLPVGVACGPQGCDAAKPGPESLPDVPQPGRQGAGEFLFEPKADEVMRALLMRSLDFHLYQLLLEARASEHSARMVAMKSATDNAQELLEDLTLEYNQLRQAAITKELLEITSAVTASS